MPSQSVDIILNAQSEGFKKAFADAEARAGKFYKNVQGQSKRTSKSVISDTEKMAAGLKRFTVAAAGVAGVTIGVSGLKAFSTDVLAASDGLVKLSERTGFATSELQELNFAASQSGVSQALLTSSLERFNKRVGEAVQGLGAAKRGFDDLGIALNDADGNLRPNRELLDEVSDALASIEDPAKKAALAAQFFGREGLSLVNLLQGGSEGLKEYADQARDLGIVIEDDLLQNAVTITDEFDKLSKTVKAQLAKSFLEAAPTIEALAKSITDFLASGGLEKSIDGITTLGQVLIAMKIASKLSRIELAKLVAALTKVGIAADGASAKLTKLVSLLKAIKRAVPILFAFEAASTALDLFKDSSDDAAESAGELGEAVGSAAEEVKNQAQEAESGISKVEFANRSLRAEIARGQDLTPIKKYTEAFTQAKKAEVQAAQDAVNAQKKLRDEQAKALQDAEDSLESIKERFKDAFSELAQGPEQEPTRLIDAAQFTASARQAFVSGDNEKAIKDADKARETLLKLKETGDISTLALQGALKEAQRVATQAGEAQVQSEEQKLKPIQEALDELKTKADALKEIKIGFAEADVRQSVSDVRDLIQQELESKTFFLPLGFDSPTGDQPQGFATGGYITGPGTKTSDSILARLSAGEFVVKAKAVDTYGVGLLRAINDLQFPTKLPAFAQGGPVGRPVNLNIGGQSFAMSGKADVVADLQRHVRMQALAQGRRT